ncbi:MAG: hypothetical protein RL454_860 [Actinomycetota bacterium]
MEAYWLFASIWFVAAATPGADTMLLLSTSLATGWKSAIPISLGISTAKVLLLVGAFFGLTGLLQAAPGTFVFLKFFGCAFLLWRALKLWNAVTVVTSVGNAGFARSFGMAFTVAVSNPQAMLFYIAVVPQVSQSTSPVVLSAIIAIGFSVISVFYVGLAAPLRAWITTSRNHQLLNRAVAAIFVILAAVVALR